MSLLTKLKDRALYQQLIIPMFAVGAVGLFASIYSSFELENSVQALGNVYIEADRKIRVLEDAETTLADIRALSLRHLASESASSMAKLSTNLKNSRVTLQKLFKLIDEDTTGEHTNVVDSQHVLFDSGRAYLDKLDEAIALSADFEKESAFMQLTHAEDEHLPNINNALQHLKRHAFEDISHLRKTLLSAANRNLLLTIGTGLGGGGLVLIIAFFVTRRITSRLSHLLDWSKKIAEGDLAASLSTDSHDEVGMLTLAMKDMAENIRLTHDQLSSSKKKAESIAEELQIYANAFQNSGEAMLITDENNRIININPAFTEQTGYGLGEVFGKNPSIFSSGQTSPETYRRMWEELQEKDYWQGELWDRKKSGEIYPKWAAISAIRGSGGHVLFYIASFADITDRKAAEARIEHLAHHDILTGLDNRFSLEDRLEQALATAHRDGTQLALLFVDLDKFKLINDSLGHHAGDKLLTKVAERLKSNARESDIVARIGGDEFIIVLSRINNSSHAAIVAEKILGHLAKPLQIDDTQINNSASIGISIYPNDGKNVDELLRTADIAMYHAKESGRNTYHYFTESMLVAANERLAIERELRAALDDGQLAVHYQPQYAARTSKIVAMEALVRWEHPVRGEVSPGVFIPIAEESNIIHELGSWVLAEVCRQLDAWKTAGHQGCKVAVNLSARQLQSESLVDDIKSIMHEHQIQGGELEIEITETAAMSDPVLALQQLHALRALGINLAIDDFGTGYSSLAYLKRLPINTLKLDRSFVHDLENDSSNAEICRATIALAHNLDLTIVAEGVETEAQRDFLLQHRCDYLQGFLFSRPLPAPQMSDLLKQRQVDE